MTIPTLHSLGDYLLENHAAFVVGLLDTDAERVSAMLNPFPFWSLSGPARNLFLVLVGAPDESGNPRLRLM